VPAQGVEDLARRELAQGSDAALAAELEIEAGGS